MFEFYSSDMVTGDSSSYNGVGILGLRSLHSVTVKKKNNKPTNKNPNTNSTNLHLSYFYFCKSGEHMAYLTLDFFFASSLIHSSDSYLSMFH